jgi:DNA excision repair protein ERCC-5
LKVGSGHGAATFLILIAAGVLSAVHSSADDSARRPKPAARTEIMGVKGLWRLLLPIGRRISIETLEGKVLAVDASIWLAQFLSALKDPETGRTAPSAHLVGFFRRLCRLRYHGIRPVFVFDGVPPEAKRRELARRRRRRDDNFAAADGAAIRRLAKRLLVENLGKGRKRRLEKQQQQDQKKPSARPGATAASFDPGFNPGDDDDGGINGGGQGGEAEEGAVGTAAVALEEGKNRDEESAPGEEGEDDDGNDWGRQEGAVVAAPDKGEKEEPEADDDVFDDALQLYDGGDDADDDGEFDVDLMANLPPSKRKDAVERAQRRRRMKSRRDFLPAAADPSLFSSVQVSNFLKTCKLNRNIHKAAARAAARDNLKDAMASDRAITVELIREDDDEEEKGVGEYEAAARHGRGVEASAAVAASAAASSPPRKGRLVKRRSGDRRDDNDDDQSEDEMFHEAWHERGIFPDSGGTAKRRSRAIFDDEEEEDDGSENDSHSGGFFPSGGAGGSVRSKQEAADYQLAVVLQQAEREHSSSRLSQGRSHRPASSDVIDLADSEGDGENEGDSEEDDNDHPGGFFPETSGDSSAAAASARPKSPIPAGGAGGSSARAEQEVMDYQLAMALEEADRETGSPRFPQSRVRPGSEQAAASDVIDLADSDTEDDVASVDWEDGQKAPELDRPGSGGAPPAPSQRLVSPSKRSAVERDLSPASTPASAAEIGSNCKRFDGTARSPGWFHSEASTRLSGGVHDVSRVNPPDGIAKDHGVLGPPRGDRRPAKSASASATTGDGADADDELEWEDGADATDGTDSVVVEHDSKGVKGSDEILFRYNGAHGDWNAHTESPAIDATAAALERGLSTASNLTNWAGVAFRKAIRASGQAGLLSPTNNEKSVPEHLGRSSDEELDIESARFDAKRPQDQQNQTNSLLDDVTTASPPGAVEESVRVDEKFLREWAEEGLERERDMDTITDDMREEVIQLLQLFGVPFIGMSRQLAL